MLDVVLDAGTRTRISQSLEQLLHPAVERPGWKHGEERRVCGDVRDHVEAVVDSLAAHLLVDGEGLLHLSPMPLPEGLEVRVLHANAAAPGDLDHLLRGRTSVSLEPRMWNAKIPS